MNDFTIPILLGIVALAWAFGLVAHYALSERGVFNEDTNEWEEREDE